MKRYMTKFVAVIATLSLSLAVASNAFAGKGDKPSARPMIKQQSNSSSSSMSSSNLGKISSLKTGGSNFATKEFKSSASGLNGASLSSQLGKTNLSTKSSLASPTFIATDKARTEGVGRGPGSKLTDKLIISTDKLVTANPKSTKLKDKIKIPTDNLVTLEPKTGGGKDPGKGPKDCHKDNCKDKCFPKHKCHPCYDFYWTYPWCYGPSVVVVPTPVTETIIVEKPVVLAAAAGPALDVELMDVGFVDAGDEASNLGPRYRVTIRNNSPVSVGKFRVALLAAIDKTTEPMNAAAEVAGMGAGQSKQLDIRLPVKALTMGRDAAGTPVPFAMLGVAVDAENVLAETDEINNRSVFERTGIPAVAF